MRETLLQTLLAAFCAILARGTFAADMGGGSMIGAAHHSMMQRAGNRLPFDNEVEYLENTVGAWIDTGFVQSSKVLECVMSISVPEAAKLVADFDSLFGNEQNDTTAEFVLAKQQKNPYLFWRAGSTSNLGLTRPQTSEFFEASLKTDSENGYTRTIGTSTASGTYSGSVVGAANAMAVFAVRTNNSVELPNTAGYRIARLRIFQDNLLVRDYIPVRKGTTGELYDRVSGKLAARHGDFVVGQDVVPMTWQDGLQYNNVGTPIESATSSVGLDYIPITAGHSFTWRLGYGSSASADLIIYNANKERIDYWVARDRTVTISGAAAYMRISALTSYKEQATVYDETAQKYVFANGVIPIGDAS